MRRCQKVVERLVESPKVKEGGGGVEGGGGLVGVKSGYRTKGLITLARSAEIGPAPWLNATKINFVVI